jgi:hypothetical protein
MNQRVDRGQSFLEYTMIIGVIMVVLTVMAPMMKRSIQAMVKVVADQVGVQNESDQEVNIMDGYLNFSHTVVQAQTSKTERGYSENITYIYDDRTDASTVQASEMGYTETDEEE